MAKKSSAKSTSKTPAKQTKRRAASKRAAKPAAVQTDKFPSYRVYKWDAALRDGLKIRREELGVTQRELIRNGVVEQLPILVEALAALGISVEDRGSEGPVRVPLDASTLAALRSASNWTDLPQNLLIRACLRLATRGAAKSARRHRSST